MLCGFAGVRLTLQGKQHIAPGEQYILCVNHLSYMDTPVVLGHIPLNFRFMARKQLFDVPFMGWHLQRAGHLPVDQESPREAIRTLNDAARLIRERRISVLVFPEGGRARDGQLQEFKEGAFLLAIKSGIPILPVGLWGTYEMLPMGSGVIRPGPVRMRIGAPIPTQGLRDRGALSNQVRAAIQELTRA
jgi:1-acyl-sn-glycerol-3-phosphate acyltransferase